MPQDTKRYIMLEGITWQQYFTVTGLGAAIYYGYVAYRIYGGQLMARVTGEEDNIEVDTTDPGSNPRDEADEAAEMLAELEQLVDTIRTGIFEQAGKQAVKSELMAAISLQTANFGGLHRPAYRNALNNFIIKYGAEICGVDFSETELEAAWRGLQS